jgi:hypothetical protein
LERFRRNGARAHEDLPRLGLILLPDGEDEAVPMGTHTEWDARTAEAARHELRFPRREVGRDGHEFTVRCLFLNLRSTVVRGGVGVLDLQLAAAVATVNDVGLELRVAAPTVANHHLQILTAG